MSVIGKILVKLGLDSSDFTRGTRDAQRQTQDFTGKIGGMFGKLGGGLAIGASIKKAFDFGREAYQAAAQAEGVKIAFDRLNDPNLLNGLKSATKGTVDELKLMQLSVQAKNFKLPVEQLSTYLKFATKRAQETGQSVDYLTQSIITGLGRKSVLILDNLGVSAVEIREEMAKGGDMAQAVGRIIQREMAKSGDIVETAAIKTEKINAKWSDFKGNLGDTSLIQRAGHAIQDFLITTLDALNDTLTVTGKTSIDKWIAQNITNPAISSERALKSLNAQIEASEAQLGKFGVNSEGLGPWARSLNNIGRGFTKLFTLGFIDTKRDEEFARNARVLAQDAYNNKVLSDKGAAKIKELNLEKKSNADLEKLLVNFSVTRIGYEKQITDAISAEQEKRSNKAAEDAEKAKAEAEKRAEEIRKARLSYKEGENTGSIAQLKKQEAAYGNTLGYMEAMLSLQREREQYAKSDAEYRKIKAENDELEKQIKLRKEPADYQKGSENDLKKQLSDTEAEMAKINTATLAGREQFRKLNTEIVELKRQIETLPQNIKLSTKIDWSESDRFLKDFEADVDGVAKKIEDENERTKRSMEDLRSTLENGLESAIISFGAALGDLANSNPDDVWKTLLNPIADMAIQLGELAIGTGIALGAIKKGFESMNPVAAVAAGVALVALGSAVKGWIGDIGKSGGSSSGGGNTFTGGYSNGGSTRTAQSLQLAYAQQSQVVVLETRVSGSDIILSQSKEQQRRSR